MRDVSLGFPFRADCEALRHRTEAGDLGKMNRIQWLRFRPSDSSSSITLE
jgi:hypothetical protein